MIHDHIGDWRWLAARGLAAVAFGAVTLIWPSVTLWALVVFWGAFVLVDGLSTLVAVITGDIPRDRGWWALYGLLGITAGVVTFAWPSITALALLYVIAVWALLAGVLQVMTAVQRRREMQSSWALGMTGALEIVLGIVLMASPGNGATAITWVIGWIALLAGLVMLVHAGQARHTESTHTPTRARTHGHRHPSAPA